MDKKTKYSWSCELFVWYLKLYRLSEVYTYSDDNKKILLAYLKKNLNNFTIKDHHREINIDLLRDSYCIWFNANRWPWFYIKKIKFNFIISQINTIWFDLKIYIKLISSYIYSSWLIGGWHEVCNFYDITYKTNYKDRFYDFDVGKIVRYDYKTKWTISYLDIDNYSNNEYYYWCILEPWTVFKWINWINNQNIFWISANPNYKAFMYFINLFYYQNLGFYHISFYFVCILERICKIPLNGKNSKKNKLINYINKEIWIKDSMLKKYIKKLYDIRVAYAHWDFNVSFPAIYEKDATYGDWKDLKSDFNLYPLELNLSYIFDIIRFCFIKKIIGQENLTFAKCDNGELNLNLEKIFDE